MQRNALTVLALAFAAITAIGCTDSSASVAPADSSSEFRLSSEPAGALEVLDAKDQAQDGESIVVVGRVGGGVMPWVDGRAAFLLVDTRIQPTCDDGDHCDLGCPGCKKEMMEASTMVKFLDHDGKVLPVDARTLLGVKEQETVVIQGIASRDETGNVSIAGKGIFIRR